MPVVPPPPISPPPRRARGLRAGLLAAALAPATVLAAEPAAPAGLSLRALAATCANCHGTDGRTRDAAVPGLAGRPAPQIAEALRAFRSGERSATVMQQIAKGYTDVQIDALAAYFAARPQ